MTVNTTNDVKSRLGEQLVQLEKITNEQLEEALGVQRAEGGRIGSHLVKLGYLDEEELVDYLSRRFGVPAINLNEVELDENIVNIIPVDVIRKYTVVPVSKAGSKLTIAMIDPTNVFAMPSSGYRGR